MAGTGYGVSRVEISDNQVTLAIYGSGEQPDLAELGAQLSASVDQPIDTKLVIVQSQQENYYAPK